MSIDKYKCRPLLLDIPDFSSPHQPRHLHFTHTPFKQLQLFKQIPQTINMPSKQTSTPKVQTNLDGYCVVM